MRVIFTIYIFVIMLVSSIGFSEPLDEVEVPIWHIGDSWTYDISYHESIMEGVLFNWEFDDLNFTVIDISDQWYTLSLDGSVIARIGKQPFPLTLDSGRIQGTVLIRKQDLAFSSCNANIHGTHNMGPFAIPVDIEVSLNADPPFTHLHFPFSIGDTWLTHSSEISMDITVLLNGEPYPIISPKNFVTGRIPMICEDEETVTVEAGIYNAFKITDIGNVHQTFYSPTVGNIVKLSIHNQSSMRYIEMELVDTTYTSSGAPNTPSKPNGPTKGDINVLYEYSTSTVDPDGDKIYYMFDWGDNTNTGWFGPYNSGETIKAAHAWSKDNIKVKAKDVNGDESSWSQPLKVIIGEINDNDPPSINIIRPLDNSIYYGNTRVGYFPFGVLLLGSIDIEVNAVDEETGIDYVSFYIDDEFREDISNPPYIYHFEDPPRKYIVNVIVYDQVGNQAEDSIFIWKVI